MLPAHRPLREQADPLRIPVRTAAILGVLVVKQVMNATKHAYGAV